MCDIELALTLDSLEERKLKKPTMIFALLALALPSASFASFNTANSDNNKNKEITCRTAKRTITIDGSRTKITVSTGGSEWPIYYKVVKHETDGRTFVTYFGEESDGWELLKISLSFDNQGDYLMVEGTKVPMNCPQ